MSALRPATLATTPARAVRRGGAEWWTRPTALAAARSRFGARTSCYRFGEGFLEIVAESSTLLTDLEDRYGECAVPAKPASAAPCVRCSLRLVANREIGHVRFAESPAVDLFGVALALLEHPVADPLYVARPTAVDGWRLVECAGTGVPIMAVRGEEALIDHAHTPAGFMVDLIVTPVLAAQREFLFVHAASIAIGGDGILLIGATGSGKTTTSLTLAGRGHAYFGDDMAAIRVASTELVALRTTASIRPGPHARALDRYLDDRRWDPPHIDGIPRFRLRVRDAFPAASAAPVPLRRAFFLRRFAATPAVEPFPATLQALGRSSPLGLNKAVWLAWGMTPQLRLLQFMLFVRMLSRLRCAWLDIGSPEATADLIESTMEDSWG